MANYILNCHQNSLLEYVKGPGGGFPFPFPQKRFFYADFTRLQMENLVQNGNINSNFAGICVVTGFEGTPIPREMVYAFRVEWTNADLVRSNQLNSDLITNANIFEIPPAPGILPTLESGVITWKQTVSQDYQPEVKFVFIDAFTLNKLLSDPSCTHIRIRKTSIRSKLKNPDTDIIYQNQKFSNYLVEAVPTFEDKTHNPEVANNLTDEDVLAYDFGYPCPPIWIPVIAPQDNININPHVIGFGVIKRSQVIVVGNGIAITMGVIVDALWKNIKAKSLLKNWKLYAENKKLKVFNDGKRLELV